MDKRSALAAVHAALAAELAAVERNAQQAVAEATGSESRSEGKYDTRATEASYLARGQAERVVALRRVVGWLGGQGGAPCERVALGALFLVDDDGEERWLLILPDGGGSRVQVGEQVVQLVSERGPLVRALLGATQGDTAEVEVGGRVRGVEVLEVR